MDGKSIKMEISKAMDMNKDALNFDFNDSYNIAAGNYIIIVINLMIVHRQTRVYDQNQVQR